MLLTLAKPGETLFIKRITGRDDTRRFLESLGFIEGEYIKIISQLGGNLIVNVKDSRIAIDKKMADRIMV